MKSRNLFNILGVDEGATLEEIEQAYNDKLTELYIQKNMGRISRNEFNEFFDQLSEARDTLVNDDYDYDEDNLDYDYDDDKKRNRGGKAKRIITGAIAVAVAVSVVAGAWALGKRSNNAQSGLVTYEDSADTNTPDTNEETQEQETETVEQTEAPEEQRELPSIVHYADIYDDTIVTERATTLVEELKALNIVNPSTGSLYSVEEVVTLIKYANGVYVPETMEEIDVLHLSLLNLLISPLNTDEYLYHVVYASGNDEFKDIAVEAVNNIKPINFGTAFAEYEENGVYPLTLWMQQKREEIYSTTNREEINKIYIEVGQLMADIMKGNGCTITIYEDKQEYTYTYTSEQILANHASAMLLTIDAQLIFANHYEIRDENDKIVDSVQSVWQVYNKFNGEEPDQVSLDEIQAWINNGCDYEWGIDEVLIDGQTFGQRIQGDMEGMALNNFTMNKGQSLTK